MLQTPDKIMDLLMLARLLNRREAIYTIKTILFQIDVNERPYTKRRFMYIKI